MSKTRIIVLSVILVGILFLTLYILGAGPAPTDEGFAGVDLAPVTISSNGTPLFNTGDNSFCDRDDNVLTVWVVNGGNIPVQEEVKVLVTFHTNPPIEQPEIISTGILNGMFESVEFTIPDNCFSGDCRFTINVDFKDEIVEIFETNNEADGKCIN